MLASGLALRIAQGEVDAALGRLEAGLLEGALEGLGVALQERQRLDPVDDKPRLDRSVVLDVEAHVDAPEVFGVEPDLEPVDAGEALHRDLDRHRRERHVRDHCGRRGRLIGQPRRRGLGRASRMRT